jgi:hypothetical protein
VEAGVRTNGLADRADLKRIQRILERADEKAAAADPAEIAALRLRAGVSRHLRRDGGKVLTAPQPRDDAFGLRERRVFLALRDLDEDVLGVPLLGRLEPLALALVGGAQLLVGDFDRRGDVGHRELDVLEIDGFRGLIARLVVLVVRRDSCVVDRDVRAECVDVEQRIRHFALLVVDLDVAAELGWRQERGQNDAVLQVADLERFALLRLEHRRREGVVREQALVLLEIEFAVDLERGDISNGLRHALVRGAVALLFDALLERHVLHELVEDGASQLAAHVLG